MKVAILLALIGLHFILGPRLGLLEPPWVEPETQREDRYNPRLVGLLSFGQLPAAMDWIWMRLLQDPSITHVQPGKHPALYYDLQLLTDLDPAYRESYTDGAQLLSIVRNDGPGARDLLEK